MLLFCVWLLAAAATPQASGACSARDAAAPTTAPNKTSCVDVELSYCSPNDGSGVVIDGLLAKSPLEGPLPLLRLFVDSKRSPFREAAFALEFSLAAGGAGGLVSLLRFLPNFFLLGVVVVVAVVVALELKGLFVLLLVPSVAERRFIEVIISNTEEKWSWNCPPYVEPSTLST